MDARPVSLGAPQGPLDLVNKLYQPGVLPLITLDRSDIRHAPIVVELDPTSFCDSACPECISQSLLGTTKFTRTRLYELARELVEAGVRAVILIGGGEPLAHPGTTKAIEILASGGVEVGLTTSGTLLDQSMETVAQMVAWTRVSVDAATPATYEVIRPHRSGRNYFEHVVGNMRQLAELKRGRLGFSFVMVSRPGDHDTDRMTSNVREIAAAAVLAREIGCDYFEVKPLYDMAHYLIDLPQSQRDEIDSQLALLADLSDETFEVVAPSTLNAALAGQTTQLKTYGSCNVAELRTLVTSNGAFLCPYHRGNPQARYGNPVEDSFADLWAEQRAAIKRIDPRRDCTFHCVRHQSNLAIDAIRGGETVASSIEQDGRGAEDPFI